MCSRWWRQSGLEAQTGTERPIPENEEGDRGEQEREEAHDERNARALLTRKTRLSSQTQLDAEGALIRPLSELDDTVEKTSPGKARSARRIEADCVSVTTYTTARRIPPPMEVASPPRRRLVIPWRVSETSA